MALFFYAACGSRVKMQHALRVILLHELMKRGSLILWLCTYRCTRHIIICDKGMPLSIILTIVVVVVVVVRRAGRMAAAPATPEVTTDAKHTT